MKFHEKYISLALEEAKRAEALGEVPVGAVVVRDGEIVAMGHNRKETDNSPIRHAEIVAIEKACEKLGRWRLNDCDLYVTLEPCVMCAGAIVAARFGKLVYGAVDPKGGAIESLYQIPEDDRLNHSCEIISGVMQDECSEILKLFFKKRRNQQKKSITEQT